MVHSGFDVNHSFCIFAVVHFMQLKSLLLQQEAHLKMLVYKVGETKNIWFAYGVTMVWICQSQFLEQMGQNLFTHLFLRKTG
mmetsp:Transcript_12037/g.15569  ORF Transcript_12037/g.15569 Transcript_12037/m.15569 type:complete len:82 (+) Transcript_12037:152-397(+)